MHENQIVNDEKLDVLEAQKRAELGREMDYQDSYWPELIRLARLGLAIEFKAMTPNGLLDVVASKDGHIQAMEKNV